MKWYEFALVQVLVLLVVYFFVRWQKKRDIAKPPKPAREDGKEVLELRSLRAHKLSRPLSELTRPQKFDDIIGQSDSIAALRAALCGKNPQHVLIYGPPGVGKTCAARLVLEEAKKNKNSPFSDYSKFIELDATCIRFDERSIADPLLGSVHDPIYQGAGALGVQGVPQPKPGAVTRAHCGVLFLDEIGELHPMQMNKLLKVLEDRCVYFESSYYSRTNASIPQYIHDIFLNGLPADFRLVGATTRSPNEIPPALRSRCVEIFFSPLSDKDLIEIGRRAAKITGINTSENVLLRCAAYSQSGRDCVNIMQLAGSIAQDEGRNEVKESDIEWVASTCHYSQRYSFDMPKTSKVGVAYGLGVAGAQGMVIEIECTIRKAGGNIGTLSVSGAIDEEEIAMQGRKLRRKSLACASAENVLLAVANCFNIDCRKYDVTFNIPGGLPVDGPSAGIAFCASLISAITMRPIKAKTAFTGEVTASGEVRPVGGVREKTAAAKNSGAELIIIPKANVGETDIDCVKCVSDIKELMRVAFDIIPGKQRTQSINAEYQMLH